MRSPSLRPRSFASCGLTQAVGSHVTFVSGFGSSCSQPLLAKRPSQTVGSGRKMISRPPLAGGVVVLPCEGGAGFAAAAAGAGWVAGAPAGAFGAPRVVLGAGGPPAGGAAPRGGGRGPSRGGSSTCGRGRCPRLGLRCERRRRASIRERGAGNEAVVKNAAP